jgi:AcrR family transcriptional regulator
VSPVTTVDDAANTYVSPRVERSRQRALWAGREILLNEGWDALSQRRVAEVAGIGRATVYRHWPDRVSLLQDICAAEANRVHTVPTGDLRHDLCTELQTLRREFTENGFDKVVVALTDRCFWEPELVPVKEAAVTHGTATVRQILTDAVAHGDLTADLDLEEGIGALAGPLLYRHLFAGGVATDEAIARCVDDFLTLRGTARG